MAKMMVAGNWKMNGSLELVRDLLTEVSGAKDIDREVVVCPPFPYLSVAAEVLKGSDIRLGAQDCSSENAGAFTGDVSAAMLKEIGCQFVILGHSERRSLHGESSELIADKVQAAKAAGLCVILCVGESLEERSRGNELQVVESQLKPVLDALGEDPIDWLTVAYEPVWAIGTGQTATPEQAQDMHAHIRSLFGSKGVDLSILYGGSVKPESAADLFAQADIDGGLIGGASLKAQQFLDICKA